LLPSAEWKKRTQGKVWYPGETLIAGIGQGYMLTTPVQLAVATAALASRGEKIVPRLLKEVHLSNKEMIKEREPSRTMIKLHNDNHWNVMYDAMQKVVHGKWGTARATGWGMKFKMAGKTGTAQVFGIAQDEEYDKETVAKKLRDHGLFIGFGPVEDPVLAVAIVAENGEHGSAMAPVAKKLIQRYIEKYATTASLDNKGSGKDGEKGDQITLFTAEHYNNAASPEGNTVHVH
jgi:penicillin-binding protein 2